MHGALYLFALLLCGVASAQGLVLRQPASPAAPKPAAAPTGGPQSVAGHDRLAVPRDTGIPVFFDGERRTSRTNLRLSNEWSVVLAIKCPPRGGDSSCFAKRS